MSGASFQVSVDDARVRSALMMLVAMGSDPSPVMQDIATYGENSTKARFDSETGPDGKKWKQSLRAKLTGGKTLTAKGHLRDSITSESGRDWAQWGSNKVYARIQQLGGTIKPKTSGKLRFMLANGAWRTVSQVTLPPRPYLGISHEDEVQILALIRGRLGASAYAG